ncbi:hypothetical protein BBL07_12955 [Agrobacterium vitis]|nr:hypothetical protein BBL07_12955 [Agrobacterium vitis]
MWTAFPDLINVKYLKLISGLRHSKVKYEQSFSMDASYFFPQNPVIDTVKSGQHRYECARHFSL